MSRTEETHVCVFFWLLEAHLANPQLLVPSILQCDVVSCERRHAISSHVPHNLGFCGSMGRLSQMEATNSPGEGGVLSQRRRIIINLFLLLLLHSFW
jgi:hypothetical protein